MTEIPTEKLYFSTDEKKAKHLLDIIDKKIQYEHGFIKYVENNKKNKKDVSESAKWRFAGEYLSDLKTWSFKTAYLYTFFNNSVQNSQETQIEYLKIKELILMYCPEFIKELEDGKDTPIGILKPKEGKRNPKGKEIEVFNDLKDTVWVLYTYAEKSVSTQDFGGGYQTKRVSYIKERKVVFKKDITTDYKLRIIISNSEDADKVFVNKNHKKLINQYQGTCKIFTKLKKNGQISYVETDAMDGETDRHLRLIMTFGEKVNEIAVGSFSGIRDGGALFAGAAVLVKMDKIIKTDVNLQIEENDKKLTIEQERLKNLTCDFHFSFMHKPLRAAVRMYLERRGRSYIKSPRHLAEFTIEGLKQNLLELRKFEREKWEPRNVVINRFDAFISIPLFYENNKQQFNNNTEMLYEMERILLDNFNFRACSFGLSKHKNKPIGGVPQTDKAFESNFDHITQSNLFILILPDIHFPYNSDMPNAKISTSLLELGFAWGLRKRIMIFCTEKMEEVLPNSIKGYKNKTIEIITGDLINKQSVKEIIETHKIQIEEFVSKHRDVLHDR
jgi:hypothetical protein